MSISTTSNLARPGYVADPSSMESNQGRQVDFAYIPDSFQRGVVKAKLAARADKGATSLTVDALPKALDIGQQLDFGGRANVVVTLSAGAMAAATSIAFAALTGSIPSGTLLDFTGAGKFAKTTARAAAGATTVAVEALPEALSSGDAATYVGGRMQARVAAKAAKAATSVTVGALNFEIDDDAEAYYGGRAGSRVVPAGTVFSQLSSGKVVPRAYQPGSEGASMISKTDIAEDDDTAALSGWGFHIGGVIFENLLPESAGGPPKVISSTYKTELLAAGCTFKYQYFKDDRGD